MRKLLLVALLSLGFASPAFAYSWWVPGHYQGATWIGGHVRGQAGWIAPHVNYNAASGERYFVPGHYV